MQSVLTLNITLLSLRCFLIFKYWTVSLVDKVYTLTYLVWCDCVSGGHVQITAAFKAIEEQLNRLSVDPNSCPTPPSEPWFTQKDLHITGIGEGGDIESVINNTKTFAGPLDTQTKINDMLKEECAHLLRKSSAALTKTSK